MEFRTLECSLLSPSVISLTPFCVYLCEPEMYLGSLEKFLLISGKISHSDWNCIFNLHLCIKNSDNKVCFLQVQDYFLSSLSVLLWKRWKQKRSVKATHPLGAGHSQMMAAEQKPIGSIQRGKSKLLKGIFFFSYSWFFSVLFVRMSWWGICVFLKDSNCSTQQPHT